MDSFTNSNNSASTTTNNPTQQKEDYLDKGLDAAEKKFGGASAQDTEKYRGVNEKIRRESMCQRSSQTEHQQHDDVGDDEAPAELTPTPTNKSSGGGWKEKMHKLDDKWSKFRPYVERLNGTIVPLRSQEEQEREVRRKSSGGSV
ncbi:hypothetical protein yc1106_00704 [Curvularia clavata]|uniref:Uncharacterized protein n=1 Tax=Curvularia clavata TaxID=95742 RepID=A0A9Q8Z1J0_CURCL|nr:hypothetical protein yc1106_00704 [Curvularia clavata]